MQTLRRCLPHVGMAIGVILGFAPGLIIFAFGVGHNPNGISYEIKFSPEVVVGVLLLGVIAAVTFSVAKGTALDMGGFWSRLVHGFGGGLILPLIAVMLYIVLVLAASAMEESQKHPILTLVLILVTLGGVFLLPPQDL